MQPDPSSFVPLSPAILHILLVLAGGDQHGYAIMREVGQLSEGRIQMGPGTLYGSLQRMMDQDLVAESSRDRDPDDDPRRRYYTITEFGRKVLSVELERLDGLVRAGRRLARKGALA